MAVRKIYIWPEPVLSAIAKPIENVDDKIRALIEDMFETMYEASGIGLAANQIGVLKRLLVLDLDPHGLAEEDEEYAADLQQWGFTEPLAFVNPTIIAKEGDILWEEGCLSVPGITEEVKRYETITVRALSHDGKSFERQFTGLMAVAVQHEIDHLDGKVFVSYLSKLKRDVIRRKMQRLKIHEDDGVAAAAL